MIPLGYGFYYNPNPFNFHPDVAIFIANALVYALMFFVSWKAGALLGRLIKKGGADA